MRFFANQPEYSLELFLKYGKDAVWHCEDGFLKMGAGGPRRSTVYYSYTNMPASGTLTIDGKSKKVTGKAWFDKQGGPYGHPQYPQHVGMVFAALFRR